MQYALLYYTAGNVVDALPAPERDAWFAEMMAWRAELRRAGVFRTGLRLRGVEAATSTRRSPGRGAARSCESEPSRCGRSSPRLADS